MSTSHPEESARLNLSVKPTHYDLVFEQIDFVNHTFSGVCKLHCTASQASNIIQLHALDLQVVSGSLQQNDNGQDQKAASFLYHRRNQSVDLVFDDPLVVDKHYVLTMHFIGVLNDLMCGLYRSTYTDIYGNTQTMATTQFEATDARRAFPCADEPALKATFQLTVTIPVHLQCISNTPMATTYTEIEENGKVAYKTITFQTTPKMSTYLLALVVGEFDGISRTVGGIVTTVYTVPGKAKQAEFCLDTASRCLTLYQDLFAVPYPLTKSDLLAIPDFAAGAMENWGCVTYREAKILVKAGSTSESTKRGIARTVCHELAHQWFGNLVTMEYWTQLYLKEGMARYMEFVGINALFPEWNAWTEFVQSVYGLAMSLDAMQSSHPIEVEVNHPDEISEIFDSISYAKGASIIRMAASYIGTETFFKGMRLYLTRHAYANTVTDDLWKALEEVSGKPLVAFMKPWTVEMGYPILMLSDKGRITVERYLASGPTEGTVRTTKWPIPVTAVVEGSEEVLGPWLLNGPNGDDTESLGKYVSEWTSSGKWFKLNIEQTGFFRVSYSKTQFTQLSRVMTPKAISGLSTSDRLGLISDSFAAGKAGYAPITDSLALIENFGEHETAEYVVWQELSENVASLTSLYRSESFAPDMRAFIQKVYTKQFTKLGWTTKENEVARTGTLRATIVSMLGAAQDSAVLRDAYDLFVAYSKDPKGCPIDGDLRLAVFRCALSHDEAATIGPLIEMFEHCTFPEEQRNCLTVMGCVKDHGRHQEILNYIFNSGKVRLQDISLPLASLASTTDEGGCMCWNYFKDNYTDLRSRLGSGPMWAACVALSCRGLTTTRQVDEVEQFFKLPSRTPGSAQRRLNQTLEVLRTKIYRRDRDRDELEAYFDRSYR